MIDCLISTSHIDNGVLLKNVQFLCTVIQPSRFRSFKPYDMDHIILPIQYIADDSYISTYI